MSPQIYAKHAEEFLTTRFKGLDTLEAFEVIKAEFTDAGTREAASKYVDAVNNSRLVAAPNNPESEFLDVEEFRQALTAAVDEMRTELEA